MKRITLVEGVETSVLGFGCASIGGAVSKRQGRDALAVAYNSGITYFDVAPSYGFGEAESVLGDFLKGRRGQCVVTTKFGIRANTKALIARPLKGIIRALRKRRSTGPGGPPQRMPGVDRFHDRVPFDPRKMVQSVQTSLWKLQTDYIDGLMLHEPPETVTQMDDLIATANRLKEQGKLRFFGVASWAEQLPLHERYISALDVLQFSIPNSEILASRESEPNILFAVFQAYSGDRQERLRNLAAAYPRSVILFSSYNRQHIESNAASL